MRHKTAEEYLNPFVKGDLERDYNEEKRRTHSIYIESALSALRKQASDLLLLSTDYKVGSTITKEDYIEQLDVFNDQKTEVLKREMSLQRAYISANKPFDVGDRVRNGKNQIGVVFGHYINAEYEVVPLVRRIKKDGTESHLRLYPWAGKFQKADL